MDSQEFDIAIIGAGLGGICFARFYLDIHPECRIVLLEKDADIGGVWSHSRVFDGFWAQSPVRMTSFSDVTLTIPEDAPQNHDTFPARIVSKYLEDYIDSHSYSGLTIRDRIRLNTEVTKVERNSNGWKIHTAGAKAQILQCSKLAVATGLTSVGMMPNFFYDPHRELPVIHHKEFGARSEAILAPSSAYKHITVIGGGKSAADLVFACAKAGKNVNWVIRKNGEGPGIFMNPSKVGRYKNKVEAGATQTANSMLPSGFHPMPPGPRELHRTPEKRPQLEEKLFAMDRNFKAWPNYRGREGARPSFRELETNASFFWNSGPVGMIQHDDFWDIISQKVDVYRSDPVGSTNHSVTLADGRDVPSDIVLCGSGWNTAYTFLSPEQTRDLGLPHDPSQDSAEEIQSWKALSDEADRQILDDFPILEKPPPGCKPRGGANLTPGRLYQGMAPLTDPSILFLGRVRLSNNFRGAEAQAIWAAAWWDGHIALPSADELKKRVAYMNTFSKRRYPSCGADGLYFHGDLVWYTDTIVHEAGLESHRKGWWEDWDEPALASDMRDCKDEYLAKYESGKVVSNGAT